MSCDLPDELVRTKGSNKDTRSNADLFGQQCGPREDSTVNGAIFKLVPHVKINSSMLHNIIILTSTMSNLDLLHLRDLNLSFYTDTHGSSLPIRYQILLCLSLY
jgi:hypothetical protein